MADENGRAGLGRNGSVERLHPLVAVRGFPIPLLDADEGRILGLPVRLPVLGARIPEAGEEQDAGLGGHALIVLPLEPLRLAFAKSQKSYLSYV